MSANLINSLVVTAIGMGLVFSAILLLWGMMAALVQLTRKRSSESTGSSSPINNLAGVENTPDRKKQAAAIAVSLALLKQIDQNEPHEFPIPPTPLVSAWQAVMRTKMHSKRGILR